MRKKTVIPIDSIPKPPPLVLTVRQVADYLQVPVSTIYEWTRYRGAQRRIPVIPHVRMGRYLRFFEAAVIEWAKSLSPPTKLRKRAYKRAVAA